MDFVLVAKISCERKWQLVVNNNIFYQVFIGEHSVYLLVLCVLYIRFQHLEQCMFNEKYSGF